jgi:type I restriction enzyme S subunit
VERFRREIIECSTPLKVEEDNFCNGGIPWITPKDDSFYKLGKKFITKGELDVSEKISKSVSIKSIAESILLSSRAPIDIWLSRNDVTTKSEGFKSLNLTKVIPLFYILYHKK